MDIVEKLAAEVAEAAAPHADRHDQEGSFVQEGVATARDVRYLAAAVPAELGGAGALTADIARAQRIVARACGSTALACAMHHHVVLAAAWRWRRGDLVVEPLLRRVAAEGLVLVSTGGNDWTTPTAVATPVEGGWRVTGRKTFASIAPAGDVAVTFAVVGEPSPGADVIGFGLPVRADGVRMDETWDAVGMRGTGSHDLVLDEVFVSEKQVSARRTWGQLDRPLLVASLHAWPVVYSTYLGVAEGLVEAVMAGRPRPDTAPLLGEMDAALRLARWAVEGVLADLGDDPEPTVDNFVALQQMKRAVTLAGQDVATLAAQVAGGRAYARRGGIDRMIRDLRAALYHPYRPDTTLRHAGQHLLGLALDPV